MDDVDDDLGAKENERGCQKAAVGAQPHAQLLSFFSYLQSLSGTFNTIMVSHYTGAILLLQRNGIVSTNGGYNF